MKWVRKNVSRVESKPVGWGPQDPSFFDAYPALGEYLTAAVHEDGSSRKTSTLLVFVDDGCLKACLSDRDAGLVAFATAGTFTGLLDALDQGIRDGSLDWRQAGGGKRRR